MKRLSFVLAAAATLIAAAATHNAQGAAAPAPVQGKATVRVITGNATATIGGAARPASTGLELKAGDTISTGPGSTVILDLGENGNALSVKPDSTLKIDTLTIQKTGVDSVATTELDLTKGSIIGNVKKLSAASRYEVKTQNGVAGIRGTSFHIYAIGIFRVANGSIVIRVTDLTRPPGSTGRTVTITVPGGREATTTPTSAPGTPPAPPRVVPLTTDARQIIVVETQTQAIVVRDAPIVRPPAPDRSEDQGKKDQDRREADRRDTEARERAQNAGVQNLETRDAIQATRFASQAFSNAITAGLSTNLANVISNGVLGTFRDGRNNGQTEGQAASGANSLNVHLRTNLLQNPNLATNQNALNTLRSNAVAIGGSLRPGLSNPDLTGNPSSPIN